jgi:type IV secretory pathway protease TraF
MRTSLKLIGLTTAALGIAAALTAHAPPLLLYNPSPSVPVGFYWRAPGAPRIGDLVSVPAAVAAPAYAAERGFTDRTDRFIKRIAATSGQVVCAKGDRVSIDGARDVHRPSHDTMGRTLPTWSGCRTLAANETFLLGDTADSFDGRYWGPVSLRVVDGPWRPVQP